MKIQPRLSPNATEVLDRIRAGSPPTASEIQTVAASLPREEKELFLSELTAASRHSLIPNVGEPVSPAPVSQHAVWAEPASPLPALPEKIGRFGIRPVNDASGRLTAIAMDDITILGGNRVMMGERTSKSALLGLGANRVLSAEPLENGKFLLTLNVMRDTPLANAAQLLEQRQQAEAALAAEQGQVERMNVGPGGSPSDGELRGIDVSIRVEVGVVALRANYARAFASGKTDKSFQHWSNERV